MSDERPSWWCNVCTPRRLVDDDDPVSHMRSEHDPSFDVQRWPDGQPVVIDESLEPDDFTESQT